MARIRQIARPWTQQPQEAAGIDYAYSDGLIEVFTAASPTIDAASGATINYGAGEWYFARGIGQEGPYVGAGNTNYTTTLNSRNRNIAASQSVSYLALFTPQAAPTAITTVVKSGSYQNPIIVGDSGRARIGASFRLTGGTATTYLTTSYDVVVGQTYCAVVVFDAGRGISMYVDGNHIGDYYDTRSLIVANSNASWYSWAGIGLAATWVRALHRAEALVLSRRPGQLFAPRRLWLPASAAGGSLPTLSAATYMPGSLTSSGFRPRVTAS